MTKPVEPKSSLPPHSHGAAPTFSGKTHIISDLHLGHFASKIHDPRQLKALFVGADTVVLAGDTSEQHIPFMAKRAEQLRHELLELIQSLGTKVIELPGNHDPEISPYTHLFLANEQILVLHGDALFHHGSPWAREVASSLEKLKQVTQAFGEESLLDGESWLSRANAWARVMNPPEMVELTGLRQRAQHYLKMIFPPTRTLQMAIAVLSHELRATSLAKRFFPHVRFIVSGHTHLGRIAKHGKYTSINTGAYVRIGSPRLVVVEENQLYVNQVVQKGDLFFPGKQLKSWQLT